MHAGTVQTVEEGLCCGSCGQPLGYWATDKLTGLLDRWGWDEQASKVFAHLGHRPTTLIMLDLDRFKGVNDTHGHLVGDAVLREVAAALKGAVRDGDVVGRFGGHGGDEFLVLLPATGRRGGLLVADRVRERIRSAVVSALSVDGQTAVITGLTASIGLAVRAPGAGGDLIDLIRDADSALLRAKRAGGDRIAGGDR
ncbi:GGDEF domain-containing protein [Amycolatopsis anabasis]|uniref:GGDEF domain-containing protein n=1 Tax=Amycolatopsis anabasis TaxID=1840409 RepID=UPI00131CBB86|nr:GGDEF domain-containing protein [Amycolatopsis anabasis]